MTLKDHIHLLDDWDRELSLLILRRESVFRELRSELVAKYGEDGVARVEAKIEWELGYVTG